MDRDFIESLRGLSESDIESKLKKLGYSRCSVQFQMANDLVTRAFLPRGNETHMEVLVIDYSIIRPKQYDPHECYALFVKD